MKESVEHRPLTQRPGSKHSAHQVLDRFPTREELRQEEERMGIVRPFDPGEINERIERDLAGFLSGEELLDAGTFGELLKRRGGSVLLPNRASIVAPAGTFGDLVKRFGVSALRSAFNRRVNHRALNDDARAAFNDALKKAYDDGSYSALAAVHEDMSHRMHTIMNGGYIGGQRFLPWHRIFTLKMEILLKSKRWGVTVPYWNYAVDHQRPDWVWQPPNVTRGTPGANGGDLPDQATVDSLINDNSSYGQFTNGLEFDAHNGVHNWCNGTMMNPMMSSRDPIFWLLHANVDRIWDLWQAKHSGGPDLTGIDARMDPWPETVAELNSIMFDLGYMYS